ncbi:crossover junction endodeoxyribonuclease RuvC [candidate division TM6 bacterium RIFCSPHIGHO2_12_FULL_32_22]|nr:MAG: crossover junction endodeoxyribonuclease RuvC [candidate division TM6 bacterium RIFCSPHIGHO2_12_FULL_32_22]
MVILGIDPGTRISGFGILKKESNRSFLLESGCLKLNPTTDLKDRISQFHNFFEEKVEKFQITDLALETPFLGKNAQNFLKLGYLRGILYLVASKHKMKIHEFSPREIKQAVTGFGGASKEQVSRMMLQFFPGIKVSGTLDVTDALAVTLCGLWRYRRL